MDIKIVTKNRKASQEYFLSTFHRQECVDNPKKLEEIIHGLEMIAHRFQKPIIISTHPRTRSKLQSLDKYSSYLKFLEPMGFFDFVKLEKKIVNAFFVSLKQKLLHNVLCH